jgi:hypothetical protein
VADLEANNLTLPRDVSVLDRSERTMNRIVRPIAVGALAALAVWFGLSSSTPSSCGVPLPTDVRVRASKLHVGVGGFTRTWEVESQGLSAAALSAAYTSELKGRGYEIMYSHPTLGANPGWTLAAYRGRDPDEVVSCDIWPEPRTSQVTRGVIGYRRVFAD